MAIRRLSLLSFLCGFSLYAILSSWYVGSQLPQQWPIEKSQSHGVPSPRQLKPEIHAKPSKEVLEIDRPRPLFILHIGPPKTATTFLQCALSADTNLIDGLMLKDNYVYLGTGMWRGGCNNDDDVDEDRDEGRYIHQSILAFFLESNSESSDESDDESGDDNSLPLPNPDLVKRIDNAWNKGLNAIVVFENFDHEHMPAMAKLLKNWDVKILNAYRHIYDWLPSRYNQRFKPRDYAHDTAIWPGETYDDYDGFEILPFDLDDRASFTENHVNIIESTGIYRTAEWNEVCNQHFSDVEVIDIQNFKADPDLPGDPYLQHLFCHVFPGTNHTCEAVKLGLIGRKGTYTNPSTPLDYDILAVHAYREGLIRGENALKPLGRMHVTRAIQHHQEKTLNRTTKDFPLKCLSTNKLKRLLNMSITVEQKVFADSWSDKREADHRAGFEKAVEKKLYCSINTDLVLRDKEWRLFFDRIEQLISSAE